MDNTNNMGGTSVYFLKDIPSIKFMFPDFGVGKCEQLVKNNLKITHDGVYSITSPRVMRILIGEIKRLMGKVGNLVVTDATANCGGSVIAFAREFKHVNAVEISSDTMDVLKYNIGVYGAANVSFVESDYTKVMCDLTQDIIMIDPPWGGRGYDTKSGIRLRLGDQTLLDIVKTVHTRAQLVILKLPYNYDLSEFIDFKFNKIKIGNVLLIFINCFKADKIVT
jgi:predicted RNA methylase